MPIPNFDTSYILDGETIDAADVKAPLEALASAIEGLGDLAALNTVSANQIDDGAITAAKLSDSGVVAGTYSCSSVSVDAKGRVTSASDGAGTLGDLAGLDVVGTAQLSDGAVTSAKLADSGATAGTYTYATVTVDAKGRILSASSGTPSTGGGSLPRVISNARTIESNEQVIVKEVKIDSNGTLIVKGLLYLL